MITYHTTPGKDFLELCPSFPDKNLTFHYVHRGILYVYSDKNTSECFNDKSVKDREPLHCSSQDTDFKLLVGRNKHLYNKTFQANQLISERAFVKKKFEF